MHKIEEAIILDNESPLFSSNLAKGVVELGTAENLAVYIFDCSKALSNISSSLGKARLSLALMDVKFLAALAEDDITKSDYIEMLVENSIIRVQPIYDRVLILVNKILDLGISNESINHMSLTSNENVKNESPRIF
ncbi:Cthe_2314 family HEPN domain-containing protein [Pseudomonas bohemica]|uniref:Cthe_2314 family HEPN domain-containing protein n=1 Tax=Pseudomonas bohemica TaxID=2044872 RepID=UPI000DA62FFF|nr:Cthe_2314 family HEPN domain-containing protein [Pseudomonas bohemica]